MLPSVIVSTAIIHSSVRMACGGPDASVSGSPHPTMPSSRSIATTPAVLGTKPRNAVTGAAAPSYTSAA